MIRITVTDWMGNDYKVKVHEVPFKGQDISILNEDGNLLIRGEVRYVERTIGYNKDHIEVHISHLDGIDSSLVEHDGIVDFWNVRSNEHAMERITWTDETGKEYKTKGMCIPNFNDDVQLGIVEDKVVRGEVNYIIRTISPGKDEIEVHLKDENYLNDGSSYESINWW